MVDSIGGVEYHLAAEVGLLSRNVKLVGQAYSGQDSQAFGLRVLVSRTLQGTDVRTGKPLPVTPLSQQFASCYEWL